MGTAMRRWLNFNVEGTRCAATLDVPPTDAAASHGLLIVTGGNETRAGAHRGMAWLAAEVATAGHPVLRFDRRGIGDSEGENAGFEGSGRDIAAAVALFRSQRPQMTRITALGNCDAAAALLLHSATGVDALLCANPWTIDSVVDGDESEAATPTPLPASAIRARYLNKLKNPREVWRLLTGGVNLAKLLRGLRAARTAPPLATPDSLAGRLTQAIAQLNKPTTILLAERDATAMAFRTHWPSISATNQAVTLLSLDSGSHGFADDAAREWLRDQVLAALRS